ncbi:Serpin 1 [Eptesipox virus]|uniref:Serpin 1 n=1 Tax=Eptesipox virus TaxID=1329402 RepID=A0A220T6N2_9POXV|nr:Serpin 1 [Eptesipox virus]ASK51365.1 Serpin 1 [Eptesipox virus]WAH71123.1 serpin 1 [Eptesipox virus]
MINFAINLFKEFNNENIIFSPPSIIATLMMIAAGANGETKKEIESIINSLPIYKTSKQLKIANRVYISKFIKYYNTYKEKIAKLNADIVQVDFNNVNQTTTAINSWINSITSINNFIKSVNADTCIMFINALSFEGEWSKKFKSGDTIISDFMISETESVNVPMMSTDLNLNIGHLDDIDARIVEIKYKNNYNMLIIIPNKVYGIQTVIKSLSSEKITEWVSKMKQQNVSLYLPKFNIDKELDLKYYLPKIGINTLFTKPDLSKITDDIVDMPIFIHKACVKVDEEGTKAAAVSSFSVVYFSCVEREIVNINKPFIFFIRKNNNISFMGKVISP